MLDHIAERQSWPLQIDTERGSIFILLLLAGLLGRALTAMRLLRSLPVPGIRFGLVALAQALRIFLQLVLEIEHGLRRQLPVDQVLDSVYRQIVV